MGQATIPDADATVLANLTNSKQLPSGLVLTDTVLPNDTVLTKIVPVTSVEILALNATPKTLVAAPGTGKALEFLTAMLVLDFNGIAYAVNGVIGVFETDESGTQISGTLTLASFLAQTADTIKSIGQLLASTSTTGITVTENVPLVLGMPTGDTTNGDSPITVHMRYRVVSTGL